MLHQAYHLLVGDGREPHCLAFNFLQQLSRNFTSLAYFFGEIWMTITHKEEDVNLFDSFKQLIGLTEGYVTQARNVSIMQNIAYMVVDVVQDGLNIFPWDVTLSSHIDTLLQGAPSILFIAMSESNVEQKP